MKVRELKTTLTEFLRIVKPTSILISPKVKGNFKQIIEEMDSNGYFNK